MVDRIYWPFPVAPLTPEDVPKIAFFESMGRLGHEAWREARSYGASSKNGREGMMIYRGRSRFYELVLSEHGHT
ncbi:MAG TPA: hypothetical protein VGJ26_06630, partial [Pirellulales bacterium]